MSSGAIQQTISGLQERMGQQTAIEDALHFAELIGFLRAEQRRRQRRTKQQTATGYVAAEEGEWAQHQRTAEVVALRKAGKRIGEIANETGLGKGTVSVILSRSGETFDQFPIGSPRGWKRGPKRKDQHP